MGVRGPVRFQVVRCSTGSVALKGLSAVLVAVLASTSAESFVSEAAGASSAPSISAKRREASRIADRIDATTAKLSALNEDFLVARNRLERLQKRVVRASAGELAATTTLRAVNATLREQGLRAFTNPTNVVDAFAGSASVNDVERRLALANQGTQRLADVSDALRAGLEDQARRTGELSAARDEMAATTSFLARRRTEADKLAAELDQLESKVGRELAQLVEQDRRERETAERRRREVEQAQEWADAKAALAARQARAVAAREAANSDARLRRRTSGAGARVANGSTDADRQRRIEQQRNQQREGQQGETLQTTRSAPEKPALELEAGLIDLPGSPGGKKAVELALTQLGKPYIWGAEGPGGYDCSGLMLYAWRSAGKSLPHSSRMQFASTIRVPVSQIRLGDLVFYGRPIHHVGMYIGNGMMVEASRRGVPVRTRSIFRKDMVGVGRVR